MSDELQALINAYYSAAISHYACGGDCGTDSELCTAESDLEDYVEAQRQQGYNEALLVVEHSGVKL